jgi:hypothetical protein
MTKTFMYNRADEYSSFSFTSLDELVMTLQVWVRLADLDLPVQCSTLCEKSALFRVVVQLPKPERLAALERAGLVEVDLDGASMYYAADALNF